MAGAGMMQVKTGTFDEQVTASKGALLLDFWAEWCVPCKALAPVLDGLAQEMAGQAVIGKVNVEEEPAIADKFGVKALPSLLFFKDGKLVDTLVGRVPKPIIQKKLQELSG